MLVLLFLISAPQEAGPSQEQCQSAGECVCVCVCVRTGFGLVKLSESCCMYCVCFTVQESAKAKTAGKAQDSKLSEKLVSVCVWGGGGCVSVCVCGGGGCVVMV